ncbi:photoreceptor cilium actin regulator isoform 1-T1 [Spinachia spinachia]
MGCSPSKGNHFGILGTVGKERMLPPAPQGSLKDSHFEVVEDPNLMRSKEWDTNERKTAGQRDLLEEEAHSTTQKNVTELDPEAGLGSQERDNNAVSKTKNKNSDIQAATERKPGRKAKRITRGNKGVKKKDKDKQKAAEEKVDFPESLVKAHQAAYAFLNPSINKYDFLLGLLERATLTQVSVQTMVAFTALRYEEMIQGLEEMADEGEKLLKENGEHLAWPSQMENLSSSPHLKSASTEPPPDLLQQLLQYTTQRMQNVSQTVARIGECALEEAVGYFLSVSELLEEKMKVKRAVETRLMRLLSRIEMASLRKPGPEDSSLFSEDSGIGAESESLAGSERRHRRENCASTGTNRTTPVSSIGYTSTDIRQEVSNQISSSVSLTSLNSLGSTCTILDNDQRDSVLGSVSLDYGEEEDYDDDDDEEELDRDMKDVAIRKKSNSSTVDREQQRLRRLPPKRMENPQNVEMTLKMKNAISGKIQFVPSQNASAKTKVGGSLKASRCQWMEEEERSPRRPQTTAPTRKAVVKKTAVPRERRSQSAESLRSKGEDRTLLELERTQKDLNMRLQRMCESKAGMKKSPLKQNKGTSPAQSPAVHCKHPSLQKNSNPQPLNDQVSLTSCKSKKQEVASDVEDDKPKVKKAAMGPIKATPPPSPPASPRQSLGFNRGRNSVKRLIDTFSQGIEELEDLKIMGPLKGVRKCGVPVLPGLGNVEAVLSSGITSCRPDSTSSNKNHDLDLESLPPPPLEVLMDTSFESAQSPITFAADEGATKTIKSPLFKRAAVSQRLRASVRSVTVLPSKGGLQQTSKIISPSKVDQPHVSALSKANQPEVQLEADPGKENDSLYQQDKKILYLRQSSVLQRLLKADVSTNPSASPEESAELQNCGDFSVPGCNTVVSTVPPHSVVMGQTFSTSPVNRGRMLPSTPSTPSNLHARLPSPHSFKKQPTPPPPGSPPVNRKLPTRPAVQGRLPSPPVTKQNTLNSNSTPYPFKAPSPPASPKVQRWSRENNPEDLSSVRKINNARSVFGPASPSLFKAHPCPIPRPPQAWTSSGVSFLLRSWGSRGRFPVSVQGPRPFIRRSHSDQRPSLSLPSRSQSVSVTEACGSEPSICSLGLDNEPTRAEELWGSQSNLRATLRSASQPDLCVIGQALHRD